MAALILITVSLGFYVLSGVPQTPGERRWIMAPLACFVLLILPVAILFLRAAHTVVVAQGLAILAFILCLVALLGYMEGTIAFASFGTVFPMTIPAAVLLTGLSLSVLYARPDKALMVIVTSRTLAGTVARRFMVPLILLPVVLSIVLHQVAELGWYAAELESGLFTFATMLTIAALVWWQLMTLYGEQSRHQLLESQAQQAERRYVELVQAVSDYAIYTLDPDGNINSWNAGAEQIRGYTAEEILGQPFARLFPPESTTAGVPQQLLEKARREGRVVDEGWLLRKDGSRFYAHITLTSVNDPQGQLLGFAKVSRDITAQKRAETQQIMLQSLLNTVVDTQSHRVIAAEALLRWPAEGLAPADFIPLAESSGLIHALGDWVLVQASRQQKAWASDGMASFSIAVNVSPLQFRQQKFASRMADIVADTGIAATSLQLEITENAFLHNLDEVVQTLNALRALGLRTALDDFGKGYSNLNYLKLLPLDGVKVDRDFVHELQIDRKNLAITEAIIKLGESLDLQVIAEGIETGEVLLLLRGKLCRYMQGFYLSPPLPAQAFEAWYRDPLALERACQH